MFNPSIFVLDLAGNGELIILFRDVFTALYDNLADTDSSEYWRCRG